MRAAGVFFVLLALIIGIVPQLTDCQSQGRAIELANGRTIPMKCHWTARSELAVAAPLLAIGLLTIANKRKETLRSLAILGGLVGLFAILLPTVLIGVCASDEMLCNVAMKPTLIFTGTLAVAGSLAVFVTNLREVPFGVRVAKPGITE